MSSEDVVCSTEDELISRRDLIDSIKRSAAFLNEWELRGALSTVQHQKTRAVGILAEWRTYFDEFSCTNCGFKYHVRFCHCPGCGARMSNSTD